MVLRRRQEVVDLSFRRVAGTLEWGIHARQRLVQESALLVAAFAGSFARAQKSPRFQEGSRGAGGSRWQELASVASMGATRILCTTVWEDC